MMLFSWSPNHRACTCLRYPFIAFLEFSLARQLTLEETVKLFSWIIISSLNSFRYWLCVFAIMLILLGKGWVYRREWYWDHHSFLVEHPQQHFLQLRLTIFIYFLLIQFSTALQISEAGIQEHFRFLTGCISLTVRRKVNCCDSWNNTTGLDLSIPPVPLDIGLKQ